jgi:hypothetical protein
MLSKLQRVLSFAAPLLPFATPLRYYYLLLFLDLPQELLPDSQILLVAYLDAGMAARFNAAVLDFKKNGFSDNLKDLVDVDASLGRSLQEGHALLLGEA